MEKMLARWQSCIEQFMVGRPVEETSGTTLNDRIPSATPGAEPPRDSKDSGSARSHSTHLETSSSNRP